MNAPVIITDVRYVKAFTGREGNSKGVYEIEFKSPYTSKEGKVYFDHYLGTYYADATQEAFNYLKTLISREVRIVAYFKVNEVTSNDGKARRYQQLTINQIYAHDHGNQ